MTTLRWVGLVIFAFGCAKRADEPKAVSPAPPSFRADIAPVLERMCARAEGCHGNKPTDSVDLDLRLSASYRQLVGIAAQARKGGVRVRPGDPAASFLLDKLAGTLGPREGKPMPIDPVTGAPIHPNPLGADYVEGILRPWIAAGAPNN